MSSKLKASKEDLHFLWMILKTLLRVSDCLCPFLRSPDFSFFSLQLQLRAQKMCGHRMQ